MINLMFIFGILGIILAVIVLVLTIKLLAILLVMFNYYIYNKIGDNWFTRYVNYLFEILN